MFRRAFPSLAAVIIFLVFCVNAFAAYKEGEVLVRYRRGTRPTAAIPKLAAMGLRSTQYLSPIRTQRLELPSGMTVEDAVSQLQNDPTIEYAGPNHIVRICLEPDDEYFHDTWLGWYWQWGLYDDMNPDAGIDAPLAWDITTGSSDIIIAFVDTGVDSSHEDLWTKLVAGRNTIAGADPEDTEDDQGHGTFTSGVAAAISDNGIGVAGVSWGAKIMPIKALNYEGYGTEADAAAGIVWAADNGAHIINMSMGGYDDVPIEKDAIDYAYGKGCVLIGASGNDGVGDLFYPAAYENVLAVGASNEDMRRCDENDWFGGGSNYGDYIDVVAPGNNIMSTAWQYGEATYNMSSGTSAAAPFAAGIAALIITQHPEWNNSEIMNQIRMTAKDIGASGWDMYTGWGIASAYNALANAPAQGVGISDINFIGSGQFVKIENAVLTTKSTDFKDRMYIEQDDRACGTMLSFTSTPAGYLEGDIVEVMGTVMTITGERAIQNPTLRKVGLRDNPLEPLSFSNKNLGGSRFGYKTGVENGTGLNNLGMLVTVYGKVTAGGWTYFYINDGSNMQDGSGLLGLKVITNTLSKPPVGSFVRVTGISSCERPIGTYLNIPVIRPRRQSDIRVM